MFPLRSWAFLVCVLCVTSCGGGGGGSDTSNPTPPPSQDPGPVITGLSTNVVVNGHFGTTLSILGSGFTVYSGVTIDGVALQPTFLSSDKLRVSFRGHRFTNVGTVDVIVSTPVGNPEGIRSFSKPASLTFLAPNYTVRQIPATVAYASTIAWNASENRLYFLVPASAAVNPNTIGVLDPVTAAITYVPVPSGAPTRLVLSDDDRYLYLSALTDSRITRLVLPGLTPDISIVAPGWVREVKPAPSASRTIAVAIINGFVGSPLTTSVLIYDDATPRPVFVPFRALSPDISVDSPNLVWGDDAAHLYGREADSSAGSLFWFDVTAAGVTATRVHHNVTWWGSGGIAYDRSTKTLALTNGLTDVQLVDAVHDRLADMIDAPGYMLADPSTGKSFQMFYTSGPNSGEPHAAIAAFDLQTRSLLELITFRADGIGLGSRVTRYGTNGLACFNDSNIFLISGSFVDGQPAPNAGATDRPAIYTVAGQRVIAVDVATSAIVADPVGGHLFVSQDGLNEEHPNSILEIDPVTGSIVANAKVSTHPAALAISDDGHFLYVGSWGAGAVERYSLPALTRDFRYSLGWIEPDGPVFGVGPHRPMELAVAPGMPRTVAVQTASNDTVSPTGQGGLRILDDDVARPNALVNKLTGIPHDSIAWSANASMLYAVNNESSAFSFFRMPVDGSGILAGERVDDAIRYYYDRIHYDRTTDRVYSDAGLIIDPTTGSRLGEFGVVNATAAAIDGPLHKAFYLVPRSAGGVSIQSYDLQSRSLISSLDLPDVGASGSRLVRWGTNGLAFNGDDGEVWIVSGSFVR